jgi:hypothetical protein
MHGITHLDNPPPLFLTTDLLRRDLPAPTSLCSDG